MPEETYNKVIEQAEKEKRKKSSMCAILIERGLPANQTQPESAMSYQERVASEMIKKKEG